MLTWVLLVAVFAALGCSGTDELPTASAAASGGAPATATHAIADCEWLDDSFCTPVNAASPPRPERPFHYLCTIDARVPEAFTCVPESPNYPVSRPPPYDVGWCCDR